MSDRSLAGIMSGSAAVRSFAEDERIAILATHASETADPDPELSAITDFAAELCGTPISLVTLIDANTQSFPGRTGFEPADAPREGSLCVHTMLGRDLLVISDTVVDARFKESPSVVGDPHVRFYAGVPLVSDEGAPLGALCVIDHVPRGDLTDLQRHGLSVLARAALAVLRVRRAERAGLASTQLAQRERDDREARFHVLADTMPQMVWSTLPNGFHDYFNARWYAFTGVPSGSTDGEAWNGMFHLEDRERAWDRWRHSLATGEPYEIEYRLRDAAGKYRWVLGRALPMRNAAGRIVRWFGTCTDIDDYRLALEQRDLISHELSHRIKNIFAVVGGLISLSARAHPEFKTVADNLRERVTALGRAHDHVRPPSPGSGSTDQVASLHSMLTQLLAPHRSANGERIVIEGDDAPLDERAATPLALVFHELATNASKYGALSSPGGRVRIAVERGARDVTVLWTESGAAGTRSPEREGFGTRLIELSLVRQLGGTIMRHWTADGLVATITIPSGAMMRTPSDLTG